MLARLKHLYMIEKEEERKKEEEKKNEERNKYIIFPEYLKIP